MRCAVQRAARSLRVSTRGTEHGAFVLSSKNGVGRASPRIHQPNIFDARRTEIPNDGGAGGVGESGPTAERLVDSAKGRAEHHVSGMAVPLMIHETVNQSDRRDARAGGVADRGPATVAVPAVDSPVAEAQTSHGVHARGELHAPRRHLEDVRAAGCVQHVRPLEEAGGPRAGASCQCQSSRVRTHEFFPGCCYSQRRTRER